MIKAHLVKSMIFFSNVPDYLVYCINLSLPQSEIFLNQITSKKCPVNYCLNDWKSVKKKDAFDGKLCLDDCSIISFYEYNYKYYSICPNGTSPKENNPFVCFNISNNNINNSLIITDEITDDCVKYNIK